MTKKVLILCTGNSCRSIIAEALINAFLDGVEAKSSGVKPSGRVNPLAKKVLELHDIWDESYHSKTLDKVLDTEFDLVVTVCDHAHETCPTFPKKTKILHISFPDPDGKDFSEFEKTYHDIKDILLPEIKNHFKKV
jgi:arsenate reductase